MAIASFHSRFRELMFHVAFREGLVCPVYCLMPDHLHLVWMGLRNNSDQLNGMSFLRTYLKKELLPLKFQPQAHDTVLREEKRKRNAFAMTCFYVAANPVRAGLIDERNRWPYSGCIVPGYPALDLADDNSWRIFWKIYGNLLHPDAGSIRRPRFQ